MEKVFLDPPKDDGGCEDKRVGYGEDTRKLEPCVCKGANAEDYQRGADLTKEEPPQSMAPLRWHGFFFLT